MPMQLSAGWRFSPKIKTKRKTLCRCSKFSLHKNFKLILEQNVAEQTYLEKSYRSQNDLVSLKIQEFYLVKVV